LPDGVFEPAVALAGFQSLEEELVAAALRHHVDDDASAMLMSCDPVDTWTFSNSVGM
jgi:hypothetical protein